MGKEKVGYSEQTQHPEKKVFGIITFAVAVMVFSITFFILNFKSLEWGGPTDWATFATYFAGISTPIVGLCSALLFFRSIIVQRDEFEKTRKEMESAKMIQIDTEQKRNSMIRQEQIERALPRAMKLQTDLFSNLSRYNPVSVDSSEREELEERVRWYFSRSHNVLAMLFQYIDNDGDIYLILNEIGKVENQFYGYQQMFNNTEFYDLDLVSEYHENLNRLLRRQEQELDEYANAKEVTKLQSA